MITKPKGTYDLYGTKERLYTYMENLFDNYMVNYNYDYIRTPIFEASELFHRSAGETSDVVKKETYDFKDRGERDITLRPEGTAGVVRSLIENKLYGNVNGNLKFYYKGTMYRYERPQSGRNREFTQFGVEVFNSDDPMIDAEVISMGFNYFKELGLENIVVNLNTLGDKESRENYTKALVTYLKPYSQKLCEDCQRRIDENPLRVLDCKVDAESEILKNAPKISDYLTEEAKLRFDKLKNILTIMDVDYTINENIVRGLDYYDHDVWEYIDENTGVTIAAGGRYNTLVKNLGGPVMPAVGFAMGVERIINMLEEKLNGQEIPKNIDTYIMCINEEEKLNAMKISQELRLNGISTDLNSNDLGFKAQFKEADRMGAKQVIILNSEDLMQGIVTIKDNATKEETKVDEHEIVDYILGVI
jgi:histidyl-tRNA synthetase